MFSVGGWVAIAWFSEYHLLHVAWLQCSGFKCNGLDNAFLGTVGATQMMKNVVLPGVLGIIVLKLQACE